MGARRSSWTASGWLLIQILGCGSDGGSRATQTTFGSGTGTTSVDQTTANTSASATTGSTSEDPTSSSSDTGAPPFSCTLPPQSPTLEPEHWLHPVDPVAGQTLTVALQSQNTEPGNAPVLVGEITNADGVRAVADYTLVGGDRALYYVSFAGLTAGENCIVLRNGDAVEAAIKVVAEDPGDGVPAGDGPWKVTVNHQWRCDEQPTFGNLLHVRVMDESGAPIEGATVNLAWTDDTVYPVAPDETARSWEAHEHPKTLVTDADGFAALFTPWGEGIRTPIDAKPGFVVFRVWMDGGASDVATEITTGLWEATNEGCNYCGIEAVNVYGHWSYTVEFQRAPDATEVCEVPTDHAGQQACTYTHFFHDPERPACLAVAGP